MAWDTLANTVLGSVLRWLETYHTEHKKAKEELKQKELESSPVDPAISLATVGPSKPDIHKKISQLERILKEVRTVKHYLKEEDTTALREQLKVMTLQVSRKELTMDEFCLDSYRNEIADVLYQEWGSYCRAMQIFLDFQKYDNLNDSLVRRYWLELMTALIERTFDRHLQNLKVSDHS